MEFTKEGLIKEGYTEEQATALMKAHGEAIANNFVPKHRFDEVNTELSNAKSSLTERDGQIAELSKFKGDTEGMQTKIKEMEETNKATEEKYKTEMAAERKKNAVKMELLSDGEYKPHNIDIVMNQMNLDAITLDAETHKIASGYKEQRDNIVKDQAFLFAKLTPGNGDTPPGQTTEQKTGGFKFFGSTPADGQNNNNGPTDAASFGKALAEKSNLMSGRTKPQAQEN